MAPKQSKAGKKSNASKKSIAKLHQQLQPEQQPEQIVRCARRTAHINLSRSRSHAVTLQELILLFCTRPGLHLHLSCQSVLPCVFKLVTIQHYIGVKLATCTFFCCLLAAACENGQQFPALSSDHARSEPLHGSTRCVVPKARVCYHRQRMHQSTTAGKVNTMYC